MKKNLLVSVRADAGGLVVLGAIIIGAVIEGAVSLSNRSAPPLVHKVPVETREGSVLRTFALYEERTLIDAKFLQVSGMRIHSARHYFRRCLDIASPPPRRRLYMYFCGSQDARVAFSRVRCSRLSRSSICLSLARTHSPPPSLSFHPTLFPL